MNDIHTEFVELVAKYNIQDQATNIQKAQELEEAFGERLQTRILGALSETQMDEFSNHITDDTPPEEISNILFGYIEDIDSFTEEVFQEFKTEFLTQVT